MTRAELAKQAFEECCNPETTVKYGVKRGFPFWNVEATQFMYVPAFHFTAVRGIDKYRYDAVDEQGKKYSFVADDCCVLLTPIWAELPEGVIKLTVTALNPDGSDNCIAGARRFFKLASFPENTPPALCSYKECAIKAYKFAMSQGFIQYWLNEGKPDPHYDLNTYPSKMVSALGKAMISYARLCPDDRENALKIATNAADFLMSITPRGDHPLADVPPTYYLDFCPDPEAYGVLTPNWAAAVYHNGTMMMHYPAQVGDMYVDLEKITGEKKYLDEAVKIGKYYLNNVLDNGSWYLVLDAKTGKPINPNFISPMSDVVPFFMNLYNRTGEKCWKELSEKAVSYVLNTQLTSYNWEGQFEDSPLSTNYMNLTHYAPVALAEFYANFHRDDPKAIETAKELMRFSEDQFVIWGKPFPCDLLPEGSTSPYVTTNWHTPCALEQYGWYVPIDASTSCLIRGFLAMYKAGLGPLYLAKAKALCDQLTQVQHENGQIPTHWMGTEDAEKNFWFNCMFESCRTLEIMDEYQNVEP